MKAPYILRTIATKIAEAGGNAILVGGAVRDMLMGGEVKDYDIEVFGLPSMERLLQILSVFGTVNEVGRSFGILKLCIGEEEYDFSLPRKERKSGRGHRGFSVEVDGSMGFAEAARRRDFTVNAIGYDLLTGALLDPYQGLTDLQYRVLRHIDSDTFIEDPLRVYRAVQFAARFEMEIAEETAVLCKRMVADGLLDELPQERVYSEWQKLLLKSPKPSVGFELMRAWGITERYFPQLHALIDVPQDPKWHPEGDVWIHTMMSIDAMASILISEEVRVKREEWHSKKKLKLLFSVLCHDFGKPFTTTIEPDKSSTEVLHTNTLHSSLFTPHYRVRALGHEKAGIEPTKHFLYRLTNEHDFIESILPLVEHHLKPSQFYALGAKAPAIRRLVRKVSIEELVLVAKADFLGRTTPEAQSGRYEAGEWLLSEAQRLQVKEKPLPPLIGGKALIALGMTPSPRFKEILDAVYEKQMEGEIQSPKEAIAYVKAHFVENADGA